MKLAFTLWWPSHLGKTCLVAVSMALDTHLASGEGLVS